MKIAHYSVMKEEVFKFLKPPEGNGLIIDATLGEGGHTEMFLERLAGVRVIGLDADADILRVAEKRLAVYGERTRVYNTWFNAFFKNYPAEIEAPDSILFDLGISSFHYELAGRGFSFSKDEVLDMRLEQGLETSARDIVNEYPEPELADLFFEYGEERYSRQIARRIGLDRKRKTFQTTADLVDSIGASVPPQYRHGRIHYATRVFQALRIAVNGELARLSSALKDAYALLKPQGRLGVISFHSLEDRIVKRFFQEKAKACICPPEQPRCTCGGEPEAEILTRKPLSPSETEVEENRASRSAKFRVLRKLYAERRAI